MFTEIDINVDKLIVIGRISGRKGSVFAADINMNV